LREQYNAKIASLSAAERTAMMKERTDLANEKKLNKLNRTIKADAKMVCVYD
jgi:hypothetical protein